MKSTEYAENLIDGERTNSKSIDCLDWYFNECTFQTFWVILIRN